MLAALVEVELRRHAVARQDSVVARAVLGHDDRVVAGQDQQRGWSSGRDCVFE
jgi:hypothetical protein